MDAYLPLLCYHIIFRLEIANGPYSAVTKMPTAGCTKPSKNHVFVAEIT